MFAGRNNVGKGKKGKNYHFAGNTWYIVNLTYSGRPEDRKGWIPARSLPE
jgi:hypothetical protein